MERNIMMSLFSKKQNIVLKKINIDDVQFHSDYLHHFSELILSNEEKYPNIDKWLKNKVIPGIKSKNRSAYIGYYKEKPLISAIVKKGNDAKICHLKVGSDLNIDDEYENYGIGDIFLSLLIFNVINSAKNVHFTLPESLWESKNGFFKSFGFNNFKKAKTQYRNGDDELLCSASINDIYHRILNDKLPKLFYHYSLGGYSNDINLILSIHPEYVNKIFTGKKSVELRRSFSTKWLGSKAAIYSTSPSKSIQGYVTIDNIIYDTPENIWKKYNYQLGVEKVVFEEYTINKNKIYAIEFDDITKYISEIPLSQIEGVLQKNLTIPQSHLSLSINDDWYRGISVATLLHAMHNATGNQYAKVINALNKIHSQKQLAMF